jgi:FtsZ-binding cell division protein ZapB
MSLEFLEALEARVGEAAERIEALARDNEELRRQVAELQAELQAGRASGAAGWKKEREEVRKRVERLVERLSELGAAPAGSG